MELQPWPTAMLSAITIFFVFIGFIRIVWLAIEADDEDAREHGNIASTLLRKELIIARMRILRKPQFLMVAGDDQYKLSKCQQNYGERDQRKDSPTEDFVSDVDDSTTAKMDEVLTPVEQPLLTSDDSKSTSISEIVVDVSDLCIICFDNSKNSVFLECGHGGVCYHCAVNTCVVSSKCPLCRETIQQIVIIEQESAENTQIPPREALTDSKVQNSVKQVRIVGPL